MLIAKNTEGKLVSALETSLQRKEPYSCPGCQGVVLLRHGQVMSTFCSQVFARLSVLLRE